MIENTSTDMDNPARSSTGQFLPGHSGNPAGRPKRSPDEVRALEQIKALTPLAVQRLESLLKPDTKISPYALLQAISIVFDRAFGRPESAVHVTTDSPDDEEMDARIEELFAQISKEKPECRETA